MVEQDQNQGGAPIRLWDTHAHLVEDVFAEDLEAVVERALSHGVEQIVVIGYTADTSKRARELAHRFQLRFSAGLHPNYLAGADDSSWATITALLEDDLCAAVGETGLDGYRNDVPMEIQRKWFLRHLEVATRRGIPVVIHSRDAGTQVIECLREARNRFGPCPVVMHAFSESIDVLNAALELGAYISFAGNITYRNRKFDKLRSLVPRVPADRLLVETDAPFLTPEPFRGKRNEPAYVRFTAAKIAELRGQPIGEVARITWENAARLFTAGA